MSDEASRERRVRWTDPLAIAAASRTMSGRDFLAAMVEGKVATPPVAHLLGFRIVEVGDGRAVFEYDPHESHYNPLGTVHGGAVAAVFDAALGCAIHTKLPLGVGYTTLELSTNFLRAVRADSGRLRCEANALHVGRSSATAEATMRDAAGRLVAHAKTTCLVLAGP